MLFYTALGLLLVQLLANPGLANGQSIALSQGEYLFKIAGCASCHADPDAANANTAAVSGGREFNTEHGLFYVPNITPDKETGIGNWSEQDFYLALSQGKMPNGSHYYPTFPYTSYALLSRSDILSIKAYLDQLSPVKKTNKAHKLKGLAQHRPLMAIWKQLFFQAGAYTEDLVKSKRWNRGAYLVQAALHCGECHTPRNVFGALNNGQRHVGASLGKHLEKVPNITPHRQQGIGSWSTEDLVFYLRLGANPDGEFAGEEMAEVVENSSRFLTEEDMQAVATYILSLPPLANEN